jgi:hypothetical protein
MGKVKLPTAWSPHNYDLPPDLRAKKKPPERGGFD